MKCQTCQHDNPPGMKFCVECGNELISTNPAPINPIEYSSIQTVASPKMEQSKQVSQNESPRSKRVRHVMIRKWPLVLASILLLMLLIGASVYLKRKYSIFKDVSQSSPLINSLGMRFVPVPIKGGPTDGQRVLFCIWETRYKDYEVYVNSNPSVNDKWNKHQWYLRNNRGEKNTSDLPVSNVSQKDAMAFCHWLTKRDKEYRIIPLNTEYRLPTDHEWSCAVGISHLENALERPGEKDRKIKNVFPWGAAWPPPNRSGNYRDSANNKPTEYIETINGYDDGYEMESPVGSYQPNQHGLYDLGGNVGEWCEDMYGGGGDRNASPVSRGGAFCFGFQDMLLSSFRGSVPDGDDGRGDLTGFRLVLCASD